MRFDHVINAVRLLSIFGRISRKINLKRNLPASGGAAGFTYQPGRGVPPRGCTSCILAALALEQVTYIPYGLIYWCIRIFKT